jgi:5-methylcytosine-specific restriction protein A
MPSRPARPCGSPRCPNLRPCPDHQREPFAGSSYTTFTPEERRLHAAWRREVLARDQYCRCGAPATDADHIISRKRRPDLRYDIANGQGMCRPCHLTKTGRTDSKTA